MELSLDELAVEAAVGAVALSFLKFQTHVPFMQPFTIWLRFCAADPVEADNALGSFARLQKALERGQASSVVRDCFALLVI